MSELKLYEIAPAFALIADQDELTSDDLDRLDELNLALKDKVVNIAALTDNLESFIELCSKEQKRITARKKAAENKVACLNDYIKYGMTVAGVDKIEVGTRTVSLQTNPPKLIIDDENIVPPKYFIIVPQSLRIDKAEIKRDLKEGDVPGVHLERGQSIRKR